MILRLRLFLGALLISFILAPSLQLEAQTFTGTPNMLKSAALEDRFTAFEIYQIDVSAFNDAIKSNPVFSQTELFLGSHHWQLELVPSGLMQPGYSLQVLTPNGLEVSNFKENKAFKGTETIGGGHVRMTVDEDFIYGFVNFGTDVFYIEPLWYYEKSAPHDLFVVYERGNVIRDNIYGTCAVIESEQKAEELLNHAEQNDDGPQSKLLQACYQVDLAIASDKSMFNKYGSVSAVENHNIGVINDVESDYSGSFNHDIQFLIVTQFVVTGTDPWTASTDPGLLLSSFKSWGNAGNFGVTFDDAELWTNRDFDGSVIGIAYQPGVCTVNKYHCLQDFTSNSELLRCLTSHEIGHNFNCAHDLGGGVCPPNYIMCPFVSTSNTWSNNSINSLNNYIAPLITNGCLSPCGPPPPPLVADFDWNPDPACQGQSVQFTDQSSGNITGRAWVFPSGIPGASNATNPVVTWNAPGTYNVKLTISGNGGPVSVTKQVVVKPLPVANFSFTVNGLDVTFNSNSPNATSYLWEFGDGNTSDEEDPFHTYADAGLYVVKLTVSNECGSSVKTLVVNTAPTADFSASPTTGCATFTVQFTNESSPNATSYSWTFAGGLPATSSLTNPIVVYQTPGDYNVTLTAFNVSGSSTTVKTSYIHVQTVPVTNFSFTTNGLTATFTNLTTGGTTYLWSFGDGATSTETNPVHTYDDPGVYTVILTATNACGSTNISKSVIVSTPPLAAFTASPTSGCGPLTVQFTNQSSGNPTSYNWLFPGGTPSASTEQNPTVVYNTPGTYSVTLTVGNNAGTNSITQTNYITVNAAPVAGFTSNTNGAIASFTNTSQNATAYSWNFGDGGTSNLTNPTHTYTNDGTYTVTLTATGPCGTATSSQSVTIATPPTAGFSASPLAGCAPLTVQFTNASSQNATSWNWQFPGGTPSSSTQQNPSVVYSNSGTYTVTLTVSNSVGSNTATQTNYITVNPVPV
nr:PKD domain-containing protein [Saprospiraceae bacterium]